MKIFLHLPLWAALLLSTSIFAEEKDAWRGKISELEARAHTAKEQGRADEAKELMQQVRRLHEEMGKREALHAADATIEKRKPEVDELHKAGKHEKAVQLERQLREHAEKKHAGKQKESGGGGAERKQHVLEAIKHLHAAGLNEPAERIEQMLREDGNKTGQSEREPREKMERRGDEGAMVREGQEQMQRAMRDMQEQTQRAMRDMQEQTQRALRETHEQMAKMARAIDELHEQAGKPRGEGERRKE